MSRLFLVFVLFLSPASAALAATPGSSAILSGTPAWVWFALLLIVGVGLSRTRDTAVTPARLVLVPAVIVVLTLSGLAGLGEGVLVLIAAGAGVLAGLASSLLLGTRPSAMLLPDGRILLRGEWTTLILLLSVFAFRYLAGLIRAIAPDLAASEGFVFGFAFASALFATVLAVRTARRLMQAYTLGEPA